jgi:hypothetical protein
LRWRSRNRSESASSTCEGGVVRTESGRNLVLWDEFEARRFPHAHGVAKRNPFIPPLTFASKLRYCGHSRVRGETLSDNGVIGKIGRHDWMERTEEGLQQMCTKPSNSAACGRPRTFYMALGSENLCMCSLRRSNWRMDGGNCV